MSTQALIGLYVADQGRASGRKGHARVEMRLMDRQCRVQGTAAAMDQGRARQCQVNQSNPLKVQWHLVSDPRAALRNISQQSQVVRCARGELLRLRFGRVCLLPSAATLVPEGQLPARADIRVGGQNL